MKNMRTLINLCEDIKKTSPLAQLDGMNVTEDQLFDVVMPKLDNAADHVEQVKNDTVFLWLDWYDATLTGSPPMSNPYLAPSADDFYGWSEFEWESFAWAEANEDGTWTIHLGDYPEDLGTEVDETLEAAYRKDNEE